MPVPVLKGFSGMDSVLFKLIIVVCPAPVLMHAAADATGERDCRPVTLDAHLTVQPLTGDRIEISLVAKTNGITVGADIIIIKFTALDEYEAMSSVETI